MHQILTLTQCVVFVTKQQAFDVVIPFMFFF